MNLLTTSEGGTNTTILNRDGCRYSANSGTLSTKDANSGNLAALIRTVGWGSGNLLLQLLGETVWELVKS